MPDLKALCRIMSGCRSSLLRRQVRRKGEARPIFQTVDLMCSCAPPYFWYRAGLIGMLLFSCLIRIVIVGLGLLLGLFVSVRELALRHYSCRLSCTS